ncbi:RecQ mediated genome instability protein Rmi1 [Delitschia confertaspora ATCC 74209]|uniref:RecQ-mediated genome instability protein 1 n=1 Tax=Delitschia confertaspora ATCC 74209 TaxID=1513339 RepID=A0A9P4JTH2_9PLEO|nr:RecQ mediated genome instability protein Rmi1 [Delitschia confertaspora ATCC 74209]
MANDFTTDILNHLLSRHLHASQKWLSTYIATIRPNTPLPALKQTCLFRLLSTDITNTLTPPPSGRFPVDIINGQIQSREIAGPIVVQVLDVEDIGHSRWSQVEALESQERGETTKGREIVRVVHGEAETDNENVSNTTSVGPHKLLLQDAKGAKVYAMELRKIEGISTKMNIGSKIVLRSFTVARGVIMLEPGNVTLLGGKIEALHKAWRDGRKDRLKAATSANG